MDRSTSKEILDLVRRISGDLDGSVEMVLSSGSKEEADRYKKAVGQILGEIYFEIMTPIMDEYPDLTPESLRGAST